MRALVIQDDAVLSRMIARHLSAEGFEVIESDIGDEGLQFAHTYILDIILVDDHLPDMSGFEFLRRLRRFDAKTPAVFCSSAVMDPDIAAKAHACGAQRLLLFPLCLSVLAVIVGDLVPAMRGFGPYDPQARA